MARPVNLVLEGDAFVYQLAVGESFAPQSLAFVAHPPALNDDDFPVLRFDSQDGSLLAQSYIYPAIQQDFSLPDVFCSFSNDITTLIAGTVYDPTLSRYPESRFALGDLFRIAGMPLLTLTPGCTISLTLYIASPLSGGTLEPDTAGGTVSDVTMWVEDAEPSPDALTTPPLLPVYLTQSDSELIRPEPIPGRGD